jgi:hypothetical protein
MRKCYSLILTCLVLTVAGCARQKSSEIIKSYPLDNLDGVIAQSGVFLDSAVSADGKGSIRIESGGEMTVPLFEVNDLQIDNARLLYQAKVRVENVIGQVYLEMLCHFPGGGEYFSRGQMTLLSGTTDWTSQETPFLLRKGEMPDLVKLNLVVNGQGTAWIDDIKLVKATL